MHRTIVQVYEIKSIEDAKIVVEMGVDHVGVPCGTPRFISYEYARQIFDVIGNRAVKVGLTVSSDIEEMVTLATIAHPDILHLSGEIEKFLPDQIKELKRRVQGLKIMQALPANNPIVHQFVRDYESVVDYFLIDTVIPGAVDIGATGLTHDLNIDKNIVQSTRVPCIIAGGLGPDNVAEAINLVRPYGVDSLTKTNLPRPIGSLTKDLLKVKAFVETVRKTD